MSDDSASAAALPPAPPTAGGLLRQARQAQGLHIAALAAAIKVVPKKLELLEADRIDQLPDATFTRALAQTVCRTLKIDAAPVLALLPRHAGHRLYHVGEGLNAPFRERPGRMVPRDWVRLDRPVLWIAGLLVVLTAALYLAPAGWLTSATASLSRSSAPVDGGTPKAVKSPVDRPEAGLPAATLAVTGALPLPTASNADAGATPSAPSSAPPAGLGLAPANDAGTAESPGGATATQAAASGVLQFRAEGESWVEVVDARGQSLISRVLRAGESVGLDGVMPMKVKVGNVRVTHATLRGQPLELAAQARGNVARFEVK